MPERKRGRPTGNFTQHRRLSELTDLFLRHPRGLTLEELAMALGVTERSMRRYLQELRRLYELEGEVTKPGGALRWRIRPSDVPRKLEVRRTQAYALLAARRLFEPMRGSALFEEISLVVEKLIGVAQRPGRGPNAGPVDARLQERFLYLPFAPKDYAGKTEELDDLFQAVSDLRPLTLSYQSAGKTTEERFTIHPYAMVLHRDSIYCVGLHVPRGEIRTFLLDRMRDTECSTTERYDLPADFSIDEWFQGELGVWRSAERHRVVIDFDADAAPYVRMRKVHESQKLASIANGGLRLTMTVGNLNPVVSWVLEWGRRALVREPPELLARVREELEAAAKRYSGG